MRKCKLPSGVGRTNFGILTELAGGDIWSKSIKRSDSVDLVTAVIGIASLDVACKKSEQYDKVMQNRYTKVSFRIRVAFAFFGTISNYK